MGTGSRQRDAPSAVRSLEVAAPVVFALVCVEALVSILARWPYQFSGQGDPERMLEDFLVKGTVLAPPLPLLVLLGVTSFAIRRRDRLGLIANLALIAILAVMAVGSLGEALAPASADVPRAVQVGGGLLGAAVFAALLGLAAAALRERSGAFAT